MQENNAKFTLNFLLAISLKLIIILDNKKIFLRLHV